MLLSELATLDVGILGVGREGQSVWRRLRRLESVRRITMYSESAVDSELAASINAAGDELRLGPLDADRLAGHQVLVRSPGISPYRPELLAAAQQGVKFTSASSIWFAENPNAATLCVTGTKGKSTTTALTAHLLEAAGYRTIVAGNIGRPMLGFEGEEPHWWVIELSSYQLCDLVAAPRLAAVLNLSEEHLDWHGGPASYRADKMRIVDLLEGRPLVADFADVRLRKALSAYPDVRWFNHSKGFRVHRGRVRRETPEPLAVELPGLPGRHNLNNLAAALTLAEAAASLPDDPAAAAASFEGLPHRLHSIGSAGGVQYIDDSLSTTPVATLAALEALRDAPVTLLVGGLDRGLDWTGLARRFRDLSPHALIGMPDSGPAILAVLREAGLRPPGGMHTVDDLQHAVRLAGSLTPKGGVVLLSPGAPSFPRFADYRDRGHQFARFAGLG